MEINNSINTASTYTASSRTEIAPESNIRQSTSQSGTATLSNETKAIYRNDPGELTNIQQYINENRVTDEAAQPQLPNPLSYVTGGKGIEIGGSLLKQAGAALTGGATGLDEMVEGSDSKLYNNPIVGSNLGRASGILGFAGSTLEGVGGMAEWGGKMLQGDQKTLNDTGNSLKALGEAGIYSNGKSNEAVGSFLGQTGERLNIQALQTFGQNMQQVGKKEQGLASDGTKKKMDTYIGTGNHLYGHIQDSSGGALELLGKTTGNNNLSNIGNNIRLEGKNTQTGTENNILVNKIDQAISDKGKEYSEHGDYAISRDATRAVLEIGSAVVSPEAVLGKAGTAASAVDKAGDLTRALDTAGDAARVADTAGDAARVADTAGDAARVADTAGDAARTADTAGDAARTADTAGDAARTADTAGDAARTADTAGDAARTADTAGDVQKMKDPGGGPDWNVHMKGDGKKQYSRTVVDGDGKTWIESVNGKNHSMERVGVHEEAVAKGQTMMEFKNAAGKTQSIQISGGATDDEIKMIQKVLDEAPEGARKNIRSIDLSDNLGVVIDDFGGGKKTKAAGFAGDDIITLDRANLKTEQNARDLMYHEMGHIVDNNNGKISNLGSWGNGESVSNYGSRNAAEDFAEVHQVVLSDWDRLTTLPKESWMNEPFAAKKAEILDIYGIKDPLNWIS